MSSNLLSVESLLRLFRRLFHLGPRALFRLFALVAVAAATATNASAGPADHDEPLLDPRAELDPRLDVAEPRTTRGTSTLRTPVWVTVGAQLGKVSGGRTSFGGVLLFGLPLERLLARPARSSIQFSEGPSPSSTSRAPSRAVPAPQHPAVPERPPRAAVDEPAAELSRKVAAPFQGAPPRLSRVEARVTPAAARGAVEAALRRAGLQAPDARLDALSSRARLAAALPELRLRVLRSVDQGQALSPVEYDPTRTTAKDGTTLWMEARATWRLDKLVFAEEEVAFERMRHEREEAQARLSMRVLRLMFDWQRALAHIDLPTETPEDAIVEGLKANEAAAEIDLLTDGWFSRWANP